MICCFYRKSAKWMCVTDSFLLHTRCKQYKTDCLELTDNELAERTPFKHKHTYTLNHHFLLCIQATYRSINVSPYIWRQCTHIHTCILPLYFECVWICQCWSHKFFLCCCWMNTTEKWMFIFDHNIVFLAYNIFGISNYLCVYIT